MSRMSHAGRAKQRPCSKRWLDSRPYVPWANSALATFHNKPEWLRKTEEILKDCVSVDIFSAIDADDLSLENRIAPLDRSDAVFQAGSRVRVEVVVTNTKTGHLFPSGTLDLNEAWLEFVVSDSSGTPILASGLIGSQHKLDPTTHRFDSLLLSKQSQLIDIHNVEHFHSELYNNAIPLGQSDVVRYEFVVPDELNGSTLKLSARVRYRKFNRQYTETVLGKDAPVFPTIDICNDEVMVPVGKFNSLPVETNAESALRFRNLGVASLRQRDSLTALWAFKNFARLAPEDPDAYIDIARAFLQEGNYSEELEEVLRKADEARPGFYKIGFFLGRYFAAQGRFDDAIKAYDSTLAMFPDDRVVNNAKGIAHYKSHRYNEAIEVLKHSLEVDPENVEAHNYCFLSYRNLGDKEKADFHEWSYLRYQPQESEKAIHELYRQRNPNADREANVQHVHPLHAPDMVDQLVEQGEEYRFPHSHSQPTKQINKPEPASTKLDRVGDNSIGKR
ncbi:MAG: tetratricopeptide repeat protein [Pirellulaceae bacterium]